MGICQQLADLRRRTIQRILAMPSSTVALSVTAGVLILCAFLQYVAPNTPLNLGATMQCTSTITILAVLPATTMWGASAYYRCSNANVRRNIYRITLLCLLWFLLTLLKYSTTNWVTGTILWYLYYTPMIFIPTLMLFCALDTANLRARGRKEVWLSRIKSVKHLSLTVSSALALLTATNNLHQLVFCFRLSIFPLGFEYTYGPLYFMIFAWIAVLITGFLAVLFVNARRQLRNILLFIAILVALLGAYAAQYVLRVPLITNLPVTVVMILAYTIMLDLCLRCGLLPSCANHARVFQHLPLDVKLNSWDGQRTMATEAADPAPENLFSQARRALQRQSEPAVFQPKGRPGARCQTFKVSGGLAVATKNMAAVNARKRALEERRTVLEKQNKLLERYRCAQTQLLQRHDETELYQHVEASLADAVEAIAAILDGIPPQTADATPPARLAERRRQLMLVKLLVSYCKRKGGLVLIEQSNADFDRDRLNLIINETMTDLRPAGVDCAALIEVDDALPATSTSLCIDSLYAFALTAVDCVGRTSAAAEAEGESGADADSTQPAPRPESEADPAPTLMLFLRNIDPNTTELRIAFDGGHSAEDRTHLAVRTLKTNLDERHANYRLECDGGSMLLTMRMPRRS